MEWKKHILIQIEHVKLWKMSILLTWQDYTILIKIKTPLDLTRHGGNYIKWVFHAKKN